MDCRPASASCALVLQEPESEAYDLGHALPVTLLELTADQEGQPAGLPPAATRGDGGGQGDWQPQARRAPEWEADWLRGTSHPEMRYGDWRCGVRPCHYANHAYRTVCKACGASKDDAKWVLPHPENHCRQIC